ncbi:hypothetical protein Bhyg_08583 [Pseudolycoriella hygida]|uniref:Uncharacterized protein n=1 Tax=Pseudolycoriella hygida TaxID=35572 RepID=A0A9Q0S536_9DIPT|nr:hypothetical protein Bhyg_08583 [Pseudolycoriella hygida]
MSVSQQKR